MQGRAPIVLCFLIDLISPLCPLTMCVCVACRPHLGTYSHLDGVNKHYPDSNNKQYQPFQSSKFSSLLNVITWGGEKLDFMKIKELRKYCEDFDWIL